MNTSDNTPWPVKAVPGEDAQVLKKLGAIKEPWNKKTKEETTDYIVGLVDKVLFYEKNSDAIKAVEEGQKIVSLEAYISEKKKKAESIRNEIIAVMQDEVVKAEKALEERQSEIKVIQDQIEIERDDAEIALHKEITTARANHEEELKREREETLSKLEAERDQLLVDIDAAHKEVAECLLTLEALEAKLAAKEEAFKSVKGDLKVTYSAYHAYFNPAGSVDEVALLLRSTKRDIKELIEGGQPTVIVSSSPYEGEELEEYSSLILGSYNQEVENIRISPESRDLVAMRTRLQEAYNRANKLGAVFGVAISESLYELHDRLLEDEFSYARKLENDVKDREIADEALWEQGELGQKVEISLTNIQEEKAILLRQLNTLESEDRLRVSQGEHVDESDESPVSRMRERITRLDAKTEQLMDSVQNLNAGYVYVVSNPGTMNGVKIGMTRNPEPDKAIAKLNNGAVPFNFVINTIFFTKDAPGTRKKIQEHFAAHAINKTDPRKQFFDVTPLEVKEYLLDIVGGVNFIENPIQQDVIDSSKAPDYEPLA